MHIFIISMLVCAILILLLRSVAHRMDILDRPGGRKQHKHPTPTVGGLAMFISVFAALFMIDGAKLNATGFVRPFSLVEGLQKMLKAEF